MLTPAQKKYLKGEAHSLSPVVQLGKAGLTSSLTNETISSLAAHELIKVKVMHDKEERDQIASTLAESSSSELVSVLGNMIILYKPKKDPAKRKFKLPRG